MITQDWRYNKRKVPAGAAAPVVWIERQENNIESLPVKRTVKKYKIFPASSLSIAGRLLCSKAQLMFFHWRQHAQVALYPPGIVITDVLFDHLDKFLLAGKTPAVIAFPLQNAPESLHRPIVNAVGCTGHTLSHSSLYEFVVEGSALSLIHI